MTKPEIATPDAVGSPLEGGVGRLLEGRAGSDLQNRVRLLLRAEGRMLSSAEIARALRVRRIAVYSAGMALHRRGLAWALTSTGDGERVKTFAYREPPNAGANLDPTA
jgi:hypothetical protein